MRFRGGYIERTRKYGKQYFSTIIIFVYIYFWCFIRIQSVVCSNCVYKYWVLSLIVGMDLVTNNQVTLTVMREMFLL